MVCDEGSSSTLQIVDITDLPNSVNVVYDSNVLFTKSIISLLIQQQNYMLVLQIQLWMYIVKFTNKPYIDLPYNDVGHVHDAFVRNDLSS